MLKLAGVEYVAIGDIIVGDSRQRREIDIESDGLRASIEKQGVFTPLLLRRTPNGPQVICGERRLTAARACGLDSVPAVWAEDLAPERLEIIELTENLKRSALPWRDEVRAIARIHTLLVEDARSRNEKWSQQKTGDALAIGQERVALMLRVAEDIDNPKIKDATNVRAAYNVLARGDSRALAEMMNELSEGTSSVLGFGVAAPDKATTPSPGEIPTGSASDAPLSPGVEGEGMSPSQRPVGGQPLPSIAAIKSTVAPIPILLADFTEWAREYSGQRFNFLHCDFPYGIGAFSGPEAGGKGWGSVEGKEAYDDSAQVYWKLIEALCSARDRLLAPSAHMMFWLSADAERVAGTIARFRELAPDLIFNPFPLIWHKSDNTGVLPDPKRGPRRTYEAALIASRGDRLIVKAVANSYAAPTDRQHHPSTKPEPVLRHFFQMFIDEHSRVLDPTCGGGSALRAAESMGAQSVLGLEKDPEYHASATAAHKTFRVLRGKI